MNIPANLSAVIIIWLFGVSACTEEPTVADAPQKAAVDRTSDPFAEREAHVMMRMVDPVDAYGTEENFRISIALDFGENCTEGRKVGQCLDAVKGRNGGKGPSILAGLGNAPGQTVLDVARSAVGSRGNFLRRPKDVTYTGKIQETCRDGSAGYSYDQSANTLTLCVLMTTHTVRGRSEIPHEIHTMIKINAENVGVEPKDPSQSWNVFPVAYAATGVAISATKAANFNYKLYASLGDASDPNINVETVWVQRSTNGNPTPWREVPRSGGQLKEFQYLYNTSSPDTCIDMMFAASPPPTLSLGMAPPAYCLGRCRTPRIINTL